MPISVTAAERAEIQSKLDALLAMADRSKLTDLAIWIDRAIVALGDVPTA